MFARAPSVPHVVAVDQPVMLHEDVVLNSPAMKVSDVPPELTPAQRLRGDVRCGGDWTRTVRFLFFGEQGRDKEHRRGHCDAGETAVRHENLAKEDRWTLCISKPRSGDGI